MAGGEASPDEAAMNEIQVGRGSEIMCRRPLVPRPLVPQTCSPYGGLASAGVTGQQVDS